MTVEAGAYQPKGICRLCSQFEYSRNIRSFNPYILAELQSGSLQFIVLSCQPCSERLCRKSSRRALGRKAIQSIEIGLLQIGQTVPYFLVPNITVPSPSRGHKMDL